MQRQAAASSRDDRGKVPVHSHKFIVRGFLTSRYPTGAFFIQVGICGDHLVTLQHHKRFGSIQEVRILVGMLLPVMGDRGIAGNEPRHDSYGKQPCPNNSKLCGITLYGKAPSVH